MAEPPSPVSLEQGTQVDDSAHALSHLPGDAFHERDHPLVLVVVSRDDPHHAEGAHHGRDGVQDHVEVGTECDVLQKPDGGQKRA